MPVFFVSWAWLYPNDLLLIGLRIDRLTKDANKNDSQIKAVRSSYNIYYVKYRLSFPLPFALRVPHFTTYAVDKNTPVTARRQTTRHRGHEKWPPGANGQYCGSKLSPPVQVNRYLLVDLASVMDLLLAAIWMIPVRAS